jgi:hypothetical protein
MLAYLTRVGRSELMHSLRACRQFEHGRKLSHQGGSLNFNMFPRIKPVVGTYSLLMSPTAIARAIHSCGRSRTAHDHGLAVGADSLRWLAVGESQPRQPSKQPKAARGRGMSVPRPREYSSQGEGINYIIMPGATCRSCQAHYSSIWVPRRLSETSRPSLSRSP